MNQIKHLSQKDKINFLKRYQQGRVSLNEIINPFHEHTPINFLVEPGIYENNKTGKRYTEEQLGPKEKRLTFK